MATSTVAVTLDLGCCRCRTKIQKILCCLQERCGFVFEKVVYEKDKVVVSGPFDAVDLCCKLRCKTQCFAAKVEIVPPPPPPEPEPKKKKKNKKKKKKEKEEDDEPPAATPAVEQQPEPVKCKALIPYPCPYPYPYPLPTCPSPPRPCKCHSCRPPPPCPPPAPPCPKPWPCPPPVCKKCPIWTPCQCRGYPWVVCCEENLPSDGGACAVM